MSPDEVQPISGDAPRLPAAREQHPILGVGEAGLHGGPRRHIDACGHVESIKSDKALLITFWCRIAEAALAKLPKANGWAARLNAKLVTARFFMERMLPETATRLARIQAGAGSTMELPDESF